MAKRQAIVAYIPVIHRGYWQLFKAHPDAEVLYVLGDDLLKELDYLRKDLRALAPDEVRKLLAKTGLFKDVQTLHEDGVEALDEKSLELIFPDEDVSHEIAKKFKRAKTSFYPVFLRWDRRALESSSRTTGKEKISTKKADRDLMAKAYRTAANSSDIWRRVGAVLLDKSGAEVGVATNRSRPDQHSPWIEGDPRNVLKQGVGIDMSVFSHAEAYLISQAARKGISTDGGSMYVTTFPCPVCAKIVADSGIKTLYISEGYGVLDGYRTLSDAGVTIYRVEVRDPAANDKSAWVPYQKKN